MKFLLVACVAVLTAAARPTWDTLDASYTFKQYTHDFAKQYSPAELALREAAFTASRDAAIAHNAKGLSWKEGVNHLSDRTPEEISKMNGYDRGVGYALTEAAPKVSVTNTAEIMASLPTSVDWRTKGVVTAVKDQGQCGSCWAHAAAEVAESMDMLYGAGVLRDLSQQQIASCSSNPKHCGGTGGCEGGTAEVAYASAAQGGGLASEWSYPYRSHGGTDYPCDSSPVKVANVTGYKKLPSNEMAPLLEAVATIGPIAISVDASAWSRYETGVFDGCNMDTPVIDHAVVLVGYGTDAATGKDYYLIRNSWTPMFGEDGYIRVARGDATKPVCGTDSSPADGSGCTGGPPTVTVCGNCGILYDTCYPIMGK